MRFLLLGFMLIASCAIQPTHYQETVAKGEQLCACLGKLWYVKGNTAVCNNGGVFEDLNQTSVVDPTCGQ